MRDSISVIHNFAVVYTWKIIINSFNEFKFIF